MLFRVLHVNLYFINKKLSKREIENQRLRKLLLEIYKKAKKRIGTRDFKTILLCDYSVNISEVRTLRLLKSMMLPKMSTIKPRFKSKKAPKNPLSIALRELGRIEKSIFMVDYITNDNLRREITRGKFMEREIRRHLQSVSVLNVLINVISICNAVYLQKAYDYLVKTDPKTTQYMIPVSPINWEHITFLGEYTFDLTSTPKELRDLNI